MWQDPPSGCWQGMANCSGLHITIPAYDGGGTSRTPGMTDEEYCALMVTKIVPAGATYYLMDERDAPADRTFRNAWECPDGVVRVNMPKARGIHMNTIRVVRNAELAAKDITFMRAVEVGDTLSQSTIAIEKQVLRDIPQTFDLTARTPEALQAKWPPELPPRTS